VQRNERQRDGEQICRSGELKSEPPEHGDADGREKAGWRCDAYLPRGACHAEPDGLGLAASASTCAIARSAEKLAGPPPPNVVGGHKLLSETAAMIAITRMARIGAARSIAREE
jgi:hypothetical protein